jgi:cyclohexyl-isocyanide hydratase
MPIEIGFLVFPNVQQLDLTGAYEVFASWPEARVRLIWKDREPIVSVTGLRLLPDETFDDCPQLDVVCVPGGDGINPLLADEAVLEFLRRQAKAARFVTSVCTGALVLGAAGLLKGKRATTHWASHDLLPAFGAIPAKGRVVRDGGLMTGGRRDGGHRLRTDPGRRTRRGCGGASDSARSRICAGAAVRRGIAGDGAR